MKMINFTKKIHSTWSVVAHYLLTKLQIRQVYYWHWLALEFAKNKNKIGEHN